MSPMMATRFSSSSSSSSGVPPISTILLLLPLFSFSAFSTPIPYSDHCASTVPESAVSGDSLDPAAAAFHLSTGIFSSTQSPLGGGDADLSGSFFFRRRSLLPTLTPGVLQIIATLSLRSGSALHPGYVRGRHVLERLAAEFRQVRPHLPHTTFLQRGLVQFDLSGYWSEAAGKLCMVGTGHGRSVEGKSLRLSAVFKLNCPNITNISSSLVKGSLESLDVVDNSNHFDQILVLAYGSGNYEYTQISDAHRSCDGINGAESLGLEPNSFCYYMQSLSRVQFQLDYGKNCSSDLCGPFVQRSGYTPIILAFSQIQCSGDGMVHMYVGFSNASNFNFRSLLIPGKALVSEGIWDRDKNQLCLVACHILRSKDSLTDSSVGACSIRICLWFSVMWSIEDRNTAVGRMWSDGDKKDSGYFDPVSFSSRDNYVGSLPGLKYNYTRIELARDSCVNDSSIIKGKRRYPDGNSFSDFRFDASVKNFDGILTWGYFTPVSIGQTIYGNMFEQNAGVLAPVKHESHSTQNISYEIHFMFSNTSFNMNEAEKILAEGIYNKKTGSLCLVGCRHVGSLAAKQQMKKDESMDCEIIISIRLAPLNPKVGEKLTGTISSKRDKTDPLFFTPLHITSLAISTNQAVQSMWRMDIEIIMVVITLTLSCIFIGLQLLHVKKNPDVLPSISISMLVILTLGHMIPLVLNFQALFRTSSNQNVLVWSDAWLEVNEVIVRVITMVAFLLQFRFLQLSWTARSSDEGKRDLWIAEKNSVKIFLPLYLVGGLIAWFVHIIHNQAQVRRSPLHGNLVRDSLWGNLIAYAGLILDGFLLPQVIFNKFSGSNGKALAPSFYVGNTVVRALPHAYDAYRSHHYVPRLNSSYLYASPYEGFYSLVWDIIIPCAGVVLSILIYLQQRFGGNFPFPFKNRKDRSYELVPVVSS